MSIDFSVNLDEGETFVSLSVNRHDKEGWHFVLCTEKKGIKRTRKVAALDTEELCVTLSASGKDSQREIFSAGTEELTAQNESCAQEEKRALLAELEEKEAVAFFDALTYYDLCGEDELSYLSTVAGPRRVTSDNRLDIFKDARFNGPDCLRSLLTEASFLVSNTDAKYNQFLFLRRNSYFLPHEDMATASLVQDAAESWTGRDKRDLLTLASFISKGNLSRAASKAAFLDTIVRDAIPREAWPYCGIHPLRRMNRGKR